VPNDNFRSLIECQTKLFELIANDSSGGKYDMNTGLKNKLLVMATAAGLAGMGVGCGSSSSEAPAAEEGAAAEPTAGAEAPAGDSTAAPAGDSTAAPAAPAQGGEGSCGENSCS
jgi:hypothetical protein